MKNQAILWLFSATLLFSCGEFKLIEKQTLLDKIKIYEYYESDWNVKPVSDGLLFSCTKSLTNGDSVNCELIAKTQKVYAKYDFDGKKLWEKVLETSSLNIDINSIVEANENELYIFDYFDDEKLTQYDSKLNKVAEVSIPIKQYTPLSRTINKVKLMPNGKLFVHGLLFTDLQKQKFQQFFMQISIAKGIEKFVIENQEMSGYRQFEYAFNADGSFSGIGFTMYGTRINTEIEVLQYDANFQNISRKSWVSDNTLNIQATWVSQHYYYVSAYKGNNSLSLFRFDADMNLKTKEFPLSISSISCTNEHNSFYCLAHNSTDGSEILYEIDDKYTFDEVYNFKKASDFSGITYFKIVENQPTLIGIGAYYTESFEDRKLTFYKQNKSQVFLSEPLYQSQYKRNCFRFD